jgi:hypothetical protein
VRVGNLDRVPDILNVPRKDGARGSCLVDAAVGRVQHLAVLVETHLTFHGIAEVLGERDVRFSVRMVVTAFLSEPLESTPVVSRLFQGRRLGDLLDRLHLHYLLRVVRVTRDFDDHHQV